MKESNAPFPTWSIIKGSNSNSDMNLNYYIDMNNHNGNSENYFGTVMNKSTFFEYCL